MFKTVVKRNFFTYRSNLYVTSCVSDAQNCGKMRILAPPQATFSSLRACRMLKTVVKCKFFTSPSDHFVTSCVSDAQNCGKTQILWLTLATLSSLRVCRVLKTVVKWTLLTGLNRTTVKNPDNHHFSGTLGSLWWQSWKDRHQFSRTLGAVFDDNL